MGIQTYDMALSAGETKVLPKQGNHFSFYAISTPDLMVSFNKGIDWQLMSVGWVREEPFETVMIMNHRAESCILKYNHGTGKSRNYSAEGGPESIYGTVGVVGQPLTKDGGTVVAQGASNFSLFKDNQTAGNEWEEVFSAVENANGATLQHAIIVHNTGINEQGKWVGIYPSNGVPFAVSVEANSNPKELNKVRYVPAGVGLDVLWPAGHSSHVMIEYDLL